MRGKRQCAREGRGMRGNRARSVRLQCGKDSASTRWVLRPRRTQYPYFGAEGLSEPMGAEGTEGKEAGANQSRY